MPCMELFDKQPEDYRKDILEENSLIVTLKQEVWCLGRSILKIRELILV